MKKILIAMLLAIFVLSCTAFASVVDSGECGDNLTWTLDDAGTLTISGEGEMWDYVNNYYSDSCSPWLVDDRIKSIVIEDGVTSIGDWAFYGCSNLTDITIPDGVTSIGDYAFRSCNNLASIVIPDGVTSIGDYAFTSCYNLTSITMPNGVTSIGNFAFYSCEKLTNITIPDSVVSIGEYAFADCDSLTSIEIPNSVTSIGDYAFFSCNSLADITISDSVTSISNNAFDWCYNIISFNVDDDNKYYSTDSRGALFDKEKTTLIQYPTGNKATEYTLPDSVTNICYEALGGCASLASIKVATGSKYYSNDSRGVLFDKEKTTLVQYPKGNKATEYTIPDGVSDINTCAFNSCNNLTSIVIPDSVTSIGNFAFRSCDNLETVYFCGSEDEWDDIDVGSENGDLLNAIIVFNYVPEEPQVVTEPEDTVDKKDTADKTNQENSADKPLSKEENNEDSKASVSETSSNDNTFKIVGVICITLVILGIITAVTVIVLKGKNKNGQNKQ